MESVKKDRKEDDPFIVVTTTQEEEDDDDEMDTVDIPAMMATFEVLDFQRTYHAYYDEGQFIKYYFQQDHSFAKASDYFGNKNNKNWTLSRRRKKKRRMLFLCFMWLGGFSLFNLPCWPVGGRGGGGGR